jgi:hypothetical protein
LLDAIPLRAGANFYIGSNRPNNRQVSYQTIA